MITDSENMSMIAELERIIRTEEAKPETERDMDLIDDCIREIAELKGVKADFSDEEVEEITDKLIKTANKEKKRKRFIRFAAGIAAAVVLVTGITACTINPMLINWFVKIVRMPFGTSVTHDTLTYINQGANKEYISISELIKTENLAIYYPTIIPNNISIESIESIEIGDQTIIAFNFTSEMLYYTVEFPCKTDVREGEVISEIESNGLHFNVYQKDHAYIAICEQDDVRYIIQSTEENDIVILASGLHKEES